MIAPGYNAQERLRPNMPTNSERPGKPPAQGRHGGAPGKRSANAPIGGWRAASSGGSDTSHPLRPRVPVRPPECDALPIDGADLMNEAPIGRGYLAETIDRVEAVGRALGLDRDALLQNLKHNLLGLSEATGTSAHYLEVLGVDAASSALWGEMIDALESSDAARLQVVVDAHPEGRTELENLLLHYRFVFGPEPVASWRNLAGRLSTVTDWDLRRADFFRDLNQLELTNPTAEVRFVERAHQGLRHGLLGPDELEALIARHAAQRLVQRPTTAAPIDGQAVEQATVGAIRALKALGRLPARRHNRVILFRIEAANDAPSERSLQQNTALFRSLGLDADVTVLPADIKPHELSARLEAANRDPSSAGTLVEAPVAEHLRPMLAVIDPQKDLGGVTDCSAFGRHALAEAAVRAVQPIISTSDTVLVVGSGQTLHVDVVKELCQAGIDAFAFDEGRTLTPRQERRRAADLANNRVAAIICTVPRRGVIAPHWCVQYGVDPGRLKAIIDAGGAPASESPSAIASAVSPVVRARTMHATVDEGLGAMARAVLAERATSARLGRPIRIWRLDDQGRVGVKDGWAH